MAAPNHESDAARDDELGRLELEREWLSRQENVLPLEAAGNEGRFYGQVLKGRRQLTLVQRLGILLIGLQMIAIGTVIMLAPGWLLPDFGPSLKSIDATLPGLPLIWIPVLLLDVAVGLRFCFVACQRPQQRRIMPDEPNSHSELPAE